MQTLWSAAVCCSVLQLATVRCSVLQCVAVCGSATCEAAHVCRHSGALHRRVHECSCSQKCLVLGSGVFLTVRAYA